MTPHHFGYPRVSTWYEQGEAKPWRMAYRDPADLPGLWRGETHSETFGGLMESLAETWAHLQPEPITKETA